MKKIFSSLFGLLFLGGVSAQSVKSLPPKEFKAAMNAVVDYTLVDVRTAAELKNGKLSGATHIDIRGTNFTQEIQKLDPSRPVFVYCQSGGRSMMAARKLAGLGFNQIYDLRGGMITWTRQGMPVEK